jgi:hypothetical protein
MLQNEMLQKEMLKEIETERKQKETMILHKSLIQERTLQANQQKS